MAIHLDRVFNDDKLGFCSKSCILKSAIHADLNTPLGLTVE